MKADHKIQPESNARGLATIVLSLLLAFWTLPVVAQDEKAAQPESAKIEAESEQPNSQSAAPGAEAKSEETKNVDPEVQAEVEDKVAAKRERLLKEAQAALDDTKKALDALDEGKKDEALAALERVTGKLDLIIARDPALALAPISVTTVVHDLYANPDTVEEIVSRAEEYLDEGNVQGARALLAHLASETEMRVTNIPLATYPAAIKAIVPLIDDDKIDEAKKALSAALKTLVVESYVIPLPNLRAKAKLGLAEELAEKSERSDEENTRLHGLVEGARRDLNLGEALGYGIDADYESLYLQLDEIQEKTGEGKSGTGFFDKIKQMFKSFKDSSSE